MPTPARLDRMRSVAAGRQTGVVVLEDIYDPHNAAAVLRSCDAFAIHHVVFIFEKQKPFNPRKVGKVTSSSANKWLDFEVYHSTEQALGSLKERGFTIAATALTDRSVSLMDAELSMPNVALMMGNEHRGLSDKAIEMADTTLLVPMQGMVQSLNLSVTASMCLYEISRQRHVKGIDQYLLPKDQRASIAQAFESR